MADTSLRLMDVADQIRSKNAGPFWLTLDVFFGTEAAYRCVVDSRAVTEASIAALYGVDQKHVKVFELPAINAIKVSFPRVTPAGSFEDSDLHAGQQHVPLAQIRVPATSPVTSLNHTAQCP